MPEEREALKGLGARLGGWAGTRGRMAPPRFPSFYRNVAGLILVGARA